MAEKWDEKYKIAEHEPLGVLKDRSIAKLGLLMEDEYETFVSLLGMDEQLPVIRNSTEKGLKLLKLWCAARGNQANFRTMKMLFSNGHRAIVDELDDLMWCSVEIFVVWSFKNKSGQKLYHAPGRIPLRIALNSLFANEFPNREVIFEVRGYPDLERSTCGDFVGVELNVIVRAVEEPEDVTSLPGYCNLTRDQSTKRLVYQETGTYIVRPATKESHDSKYVLSSVKNGRVVHFKIYYCLEKPTSSIQHFLFDDGCKAYRLKSLIDFYKNNNFSSNLDVVPSFKLKEPVLL